jgi:hypothetical protein
MTAPVTVVTGASGGIGTTWLLSAEASYVPPATLRVAGGR